MSSPRWLRRLAATLGLRATDREIDQEFASHLDEEIDDLVRRGHSSAEARRLALIRAGGLEAAKERVRDSRGIGWIESLWRDVRYGVRFLRRSPGFSAAAVLSLALGIGANTAIFAIVDNLLLRPLPVANAQQLAQLTSEGDRPNFTNPMWEQWRERTDLTAGLAAFSMNDFNLAETGRTDRVRGLWVSGGFFDVLGVRPILGRGIAATDDRRGGGPDGAVVVLNEQFWRSRFHGDPSVIGRRLTMDHVPFTIVGITPASFFGPAVGSRFDVAVPISAEALIRGKQSSLDRRSSWWLRVFARLKPGQTVGQLTAAMAVEHSRVRSATIPTDWNPEDLGDYMKTAGHAIAAPDGGRSYVRGQYRDALVAVMVVVAFVLLIACVNIANLLLARADARTHELSVRLALGATRGRLIRQLLVESLVLSAAGGGLALVFAQWSSQLLVTQFSTFADRIDMDLSVDWRVAAFTAAVAAVVTMVFGLAPALRATRVQPTDALRERGRSERGHARWGVGSALVVLQVALCLALVVAAGLFGRTFTTLAARPLGFDSEHVLHVNMAMPSNDARENAARVERYERARVAVAAVSGVRSAALSVLTPFSNFQWSTRLEKRPNESLTDEQRDVWVNAVGPGWFATVGTTPLSGRDVEPARSSTGPKEVVVNETMARRFFSGRSPIGQVVHEMGNPGVPADDLTIVGVVKDALYDSLRDDAPATMYFQVERGGLPATEMVLNIRLGPEPGANLQANIAAAISTSAPELSFEFRPMAEQVAARLVRERMVAMLSGFFGVLALALAGLGLYGVVSYGGQVEIGIRLALGAKPGSVVWLVGGRVAWLIGGGILLGGIVSWWAARFASALLFGLKATDPFTFVMAGVVLMLVGVVAAVVPAWRASKTDAASVLRQS